MSDAATTAEDIKLQMRQLRRDLGAEVVEIVDQAMVLTDWRHYVRSHPWFCVGAAAVVGYLLVPPRREVIRPDAKTLAELMEAGKVKVDAEVKTRESPGIVSTLANAALGIALQGGTSLVTHQLNRWMASQLAKAGESAPGSGRGTPP